MAHSLDKNFLSSPYNKEEVSSDNEFPYNKQDFSPCGHGLSPELKSAGGAANILAIEAFSSPNSDFLLDRDITRSREYAPLSYDEPDFTSFVNETDAVGLGTWEGKKRKRSIQDKGQLEKCQRPKKSEKEEIEEGDVSGENQYDEDELPRIVENTINPAEEDLLLLTEKKRNSTLYLNPPCHLF